MPPVQFVLPSSSEAPITSAESQRTTWVVAHDYAPAGMGDQAPRAAVLGGVLNATEAEAFRTAAHFWSLHTTATLILRPWNTVDAQERDAAVAAMLFPASQSLDPPP